jgi:hypothetical protein
VRPWATPDGGKMQKAKINAKKICLDPIISFKRMSNQKVQYRLNPH